MFSKLSELDLHVSEKQVDSKWVMLRQFLFFESHWQENEIYKTDQRQGESKFVFKICPLSLDILSIT